MCLPALSSCPPPLLMHLNPPSRTSRHRCCHPTCSARKFGSRVMRNLRRPALMSSLTCALSNLARHWKIGTYRKRSRNNSQSTTNSISHYPCIHNTTAPPPMQARHPSGDVRAASIRSTEDVWGDDPFQWALQQCVGVRLLHHPRSRWQFHTLATPPSLLWDDVPSQAMPAICYPLSPTLTPPYAPPSLASCPGVEL
jgi:hypothetical protein